MTRRVTDQILKRIAALESRLSTDDRGWVEIVYNDGERPDDDIDKLVADGNRMIEQIIIESKPHVAQPLPEKYQRIADEQAKYGRWQ